MNILPGSMRFGAGQPVKRLEDQRLVTGKGHFIDDKPEDGALWLHVLRSPHAHANIKSIDAKAALAMPGVEAVYTGADLVKDDIGTLPTLAIFKRPDGSPMSDAAAGACWRIEVVRYAGEGVAAVVATSRSAGADRGRGDRGRLTRCCPRWSIRSRRSSRARRRSGRRRPTTSWPR